MPRKLEELGPSNEALKRAAFMNDRYKSLVNAKLEPVDPCVHMMVCEQDCDQWLEERSKTIGCSDLGSIKGVNYFKTDREFLWEKRYEDTRFEPGRAAKLGHEKEPYGAKLFEKLKDMTCVRAGMYRNSQYPVMHASPDYWVFNRDGSVHDVPLLELKYCYKTSIPATPYVSHVLQCCGQMAITGQTECYLMYYTDCQLPIDMGTVMQKYPPPPRIFRIPAMRRSHFHAAIYYHVEKFYAAWKCEPGTIETFLGEDDDDV